MFPINILFGTSFHWLFVEKENKILEFQSLFVTESHKLISNRHYTVNGLVTMCYRVILSILCWSHDLLSFFKNV